MYDTPVPGASNAVVGVTGVLVKVRNRLSTETGDCCMPMHLRKGQLRSVWKAITVRSTAANWVSHRGGFGVRRPSRTPALGLMQA